MSDIVDDDVQFGDSASERSDNFDHIVRHYLNGPHFFKSGVVQCLYDWWLTYAPDIPQRRHFDLVEHAPIAANLFLVSVLDKGKFEYRINGEEVVNLIGVSLKGVILSEDNDDPAMANLARYYQDTVENRLARACTGMVRPAPRQAVAFETVDCPLVDRDGKVTHIVGAIGTI